jgi:hypothetical protein
MITLIRFTLGVSFLSVVCACTGASEVSAASQASSGTFDQNHALWTKVLAAHVRDDGFDYAKLKADRGDLDRYVASLEAVKPEEFAKWSKPDRFAFWIDAYNAYTIRLVVDKYPIESIKDVGNILKSVWDREIVSLAALAPELKKDKLTLNDVEHKILRPVFTDARVHAAINCASRGCPPLRAEAFRGAVLDAQLDDQVSRWLHDPQRNKFDESKSKLLISKIFDWFKEDFVRDAGSVPAWIAKHVPEHRPWLTDPKRKLDIEYADYSWKLNDASERAK